MDNTLTKTRQIGKEFIKLTSCLSTNDITSEIMTKTPLSHGTVITTKEQTKGKGQRGNSWEAEADKNLTFSILLRPESLVPANQFQLNLVISLGIFDYLTSKNIKSIQIKWPNDIYVNDRKIAGILIENAIKLGKIATSVVGIGININQHQFIELNAVSLTQLSNQSYDLDEELNQLLGHINNRYDEYLTDNIAKLKKDYMRNLMWRDEPHHFIANNKKFSGVISNVDDLGRLIVQTETGTSFYSFKEIKFVL